MSKKITDTGDTAPTQASATVGDIVSSLFDPDVALTGAYKYVQLGLVALAGNAYGNYRHSGSFFDFG